MAWLPVVFFVESEDNSTDQLYTPVSSYQGEDQFSQSQGLPGRSKRRLVTTRGFVNSGLQTTSHQKLETPNNSPILACCRVHSFISKYDFGRQTCWHLCKYTVEMMIIKVCVVGSGASDEDEGTPSQIIAVPHGLPTMKLQFGLARNPDDRSSCKSLKLCALYLLFR